jgi:hypothetical protein
MPPLVLNFFQRMGGPPADYKRLEERTELLK